MPTISALVWITISSEAARESTHDTEAHICSLQHTNRHLACFVICLQHLMIGRCALAGAQIPLEDVPSVQKEVVMRCRQMGRPVIVASHLLQSMIEYPTPTRAEVGFRI